MGVRHHAEIVLAYGTGNPDDGRSSDPNANHEWRPFYFAECWCEWEGAMHERAADAFDEARQHTPDVAVDIWTNGGVRIPGPPASD